MSKLADLQERLAASNQRAQAIQKKADDEQRDLNAEEAQELDAELATFEKLSADVQRQIKLGEQSESLSIGIGRKTEADAPTETAETPDGPVTQRVQSKLASKLPAIPVSHNAYKGTWGFSSFGDFALSVRTAACNRGFDRRLDTVQKLASASTYGTEGTGADGGFAVPPDFRNEIMIKVMGENSLASLCDVVPTQSNNFTCPIDETTPWQTSGGILASWDQEAAAATQSKPALGQVNIRLNKLRALVPVTEELLEDSSAMDAYLRRKAPEKIAFKVNLAIVQGTGAGQPLGFMSSGCLVTVSKESGQQADTIVGNNITKMYTAMSSNSKSRGVWLVNPDVMPMIMKLSIPGTDNTGNAVTGWGALLYVPPGGLSATPYGTLLGRPIIETQACETLGDVGDILFADLSQYLLLTKGGVNPRVETSMHLWFDQDLMAFKFVLRVGGQPWWSTTHSARDGSQTFAPFVALEAR